MTAAFDGSAVLDGATPRLEVDTLLDDPHTRILVCCGSGGVGKTTTAAALGVRAAERGRRVVVLTIDPARRLAQSMGICELDNVPRRVKDVDGGAGGELHAMMLDMKRTFDEIVEAHADPERARAILENPFYQSLSAGFAGTQEYMAMEKLGQLRSRDDWDLIVVDTPPSRSALDFLDAPKRLGSFLDGRFLRVLMAPAKAGGRAGMRFLNAGVSIMTGILNKVVGGQLLKDVQTFVAAMDTMFGGFRTRADATYRLLQAPGTAFLVVATPERDALREASYFVERLAADHMPLAGLVLNRVHASGAVELSAEQALAAAEALTTPAAGPGTATGGSRGTEVDRAAEESLAGHGGVAGGAAPGPSENLGNRRIVDLGAGNAGFGAADDTSPPVAAPAQHSTPPITPNPATSATEHVGDGAGPAPTAPGADRAPRDDTPVGAPPAPLSGERLAAGMLRLHAERMRVLARERRTRERFSALHPEVAVAEVAALPGDVHDLTGLRAIGARLASSDTDAGPAGPSPADPSPADPGSANPDLADPDSADRG
ncbi:ArsA-related P-loop ATPase [Streptomyces sp. NPDC059740]|uniref:ArsA family ATPase n=1 Tax=Streptomyces sp. NPDC059740 TaxID=3346926 RepID=UPI00364D2473